MLSVKEADLLLSERVARMATVNAADKWPHVVSVCFAFDGKSIYSTLHSSSKRLRNIMAGSKTSILIDRYLEEKGEWKVLCGLLIYGDVKILTWHGDKEEFMHGWKLLIQKYPQYRKWADSSFAPKDPEKRRVLRIAPRKITRWGFS